ncbi:histone H4-like [Hibiscus syriacus]|uniref:Histone H4-like n=1 Tax=Hibiscus syriacus TaxID=106335 RepID=A0A6A2ZQH2_HIBSY|nr:histone H4-like [Hibiscus syriacus]
MYGQPTFSSSSEFLCDLLTYPHVMSSPLSPLSQLTVSNSATEVVQSSSSGSYSSPSSLASCCTQRPLQRNELRCRFASSLNDFIDSGSGPVRRVFSTGDLHQVQQCGRRAESQLSESNAIIEGMSRACRYSPQEKRERIQRYRTKRNHRNFNKKIKEKIGRQQATHPRAVHKKYRN